MAEVGGANVLKSVKLANAKLRRLRDQFRTYRGLENNYSKKASRKLQEIAMTRHLMKENGIPEDE
jgi:hypothetical protein